MAICNELLADLFAELALGSGAAAAVAIAALYGEAAAEMGVMACSNASVSGFTFWLCQRSHHVLLKMLIFGDEFNIHHGHFDHIV